MGLRDVTVDLTPLRRSAALRRLWTGSLTSSLGSRVTDVALAFQVYERTGSTLAVGMLGLATMVPRLALSLFGGAVADRHDRRRVLLIVEAAGAVVAGTLVLASLGGAPVWTFYLLAAANAGLAAVGVPTIRSAVPLIVPPDLYTATMALSAFTSSTTWLIGPALGGILLAVGGPALAYSVDALSFLIALVAIWTLRSLPRTQSTASSAWRSMREGLAALRKRQTVLGAFALDLNAMVFGMPTALFPAITDQRFGGREWVLGLLTSAPFAGSLVASGTSGWTRRVHRHGRAVVLCVMGWGCAIAVFGLVHSLWASLLTLAVAGGSDMVSGIFRQSILVSDTPPELLGRMEGVGMAVWTTGPALGDLESGAMAALTSVTFSVVSGGLLCIGGATVLAGLLPGFSRYDTRSKQPDHDAPVSSG